MGTRKKCEHGIFIGFDDKVKVHRVYIKRTNKILVSQHVQSINLAKTNIDNDLSAVDDRPTFNISDAESIPSQSENDLDALKGEVGDDEVARAEKELEAITKGYIDQVDDALKKKEAELLEV